MSAYKISDIPYLYTALLRHGHSFGQCGKCGKRTLADIAGANVYYSSPLDEIQFDFECCNCGRKSSSVKMVEHKHRHYIRTFANEMHHPHFVYNALPFNLEKCRACGDDIFPGQINKGWAQWYQGDIHTSFDYRCICGHAGTFQQVNSAGIIYRTIALKGGTSINPNRPPSNSKSVRQKAPLNTPNEIIYPDRAYAAFSGSPMKCGNCSADLSPHHIKKGWAQWFLGDIDAAFRYNCSCGYAGSFRLVDPPEVVSYPFALKGGTYIDPKHPCDNGNGTSEVPKKVPTNTQMTPEERREWFNKIMGEGF